MKKLAIVGAEERTRNNAPWDDMSYEIIGISLWSHAPWMKRCNAIIEVHNIDELKDEPLDKEYWPWLQNVDIPVYMHRIDDRIKSAVEYPMKEVKEMLAGINVMGKQAKTLNSSVVEAIALGVYHKYDVIDVYGVEMSLSSEYRAQQPMFAFWAGFAAGRGVKLNINCSEKLLNQPIYGYDTQMNYDRLHEFLIGLEDQRTKTNDALNQVIGAQTAIRKLMEE